MQVSNIDIVAFETSCNVATNTRAWNKRTQGWLERYVYMRTGKGLLTQKSSNVVHRAYCCAACANAVRGSAASRYHTVPCGSIFKGWLARLLLKIPYGGAPWIDFQEMVGYSSIAAQYNMVVAKTGGANIVFFFFLLAWCLYHYHVVCVCTFSESNSINRRDRYIDRQIDKW